MTIVDKILAKFGYVKAPKEPQRLEYMGRKVVCLTFADAVRRPLFSKTYYGLQTPEVVSEILRRGLEHQMIHKLKEHIEYQTIDDPDSKDIKIVATLELLAKDSQYSWTRSQ